MTETKKEKVTETRKRIESLAAATSKGAIFHDMGGGHLASDGLF